jgi:hypothetical protein
LELSDNGYKVAVILDFVYTMIVVGWSLFADVVYAGWYRKQVGLVVCRFCIFF